ncbi:MAG: hypothetical protein QOC58_562 [Mycobacterium sp.]|nr:hypothetical protein [Mycobacterium sp.]
MQKFRICAGAVKVLSAKLLMGISWSTCSGARIQGIHPGSPRPTWTQSDPGARVYAANMASARKSQWKTFRRIAQSVVVTGAPRLVRHLENSPTVLRELQQAVKITANVIAAAAPQPPAAITTGRPVTSISFPTAQRARKLMYAPDLEGRADPGEIVWTWVVYEDDPTRGKDRPVLVVGRERSVLLGLLLSSQERHAGDRNWVGIGSGNWDCDGRESWVRLDRVLDVPEEGIRREGAILDREIFDAVAARLRAEYSWR